MRCGENLFANQLVEALHNQLDRVNGDAAPVRWHAVQVDPRDEVFFEFLRGNQNALQNRSRSMLMTKTELPSSAHFGCRLSSD